MRDEHFLQTLWQRDSQDTEGLIAFVRRERRRQSVLLAGEWAICIAGVLIGVALAIFSAEPARRLAGLLAIAYSLCGAIVTQWARAAFVRRLSQPLAGTIDGDKHDVAIVHRLTIAGWTMIGLGLLFVAAVLAASGQPLSEVVARPEQLAVTLGAATVLLGAAVWQWRFARARALELERLLQFQRDVRGQES